MTFDLREKTESSASFLLRIKEFIGQFGFDADSTLACISICRDELCQPFVSQLKNEWGEAFDLSGLAGLPFAGVTGLTAASHHAPVVNGKRRILLVGLAHMGLANDGTFGDVFRPGLNNTSRACGALDLLSNEVENTNLSEAPEPAHNDIEYGWVRKKLWHIATPNLYETTQKTQEIIHKELISLAESVLGNNDDDYAIFTGILLHTEDGNHVVEYKSSHIVIDNNVVNSAV
ncbi:MAG: hypothetical protein HOE92_07505 [Euryarchaeota archaeon]|jgi:hypothetical protein|nr:hypothetical protein [Euryarchaeota archaeon]MBT3972046.1 hypothetical protein [Euryarchaeota archaeon]MBT4407062.1 hypothetical protein [Euryarchaeota archaeon]MBT6644367.1 hypothetical protein [Euryarchaeota archaeon]